MSAFALRKGKSDFDFLTLNCICRVKNGFLKKKICFLQIKAKYKYFNASTLHYNETHSKLAEIETDLSSVRSIRTFLIINVGRDTTYNALLPLVEQTICDLDTIVAAVNAQIERLEEFRNAFDDGSDVDDILRWMLYA